MRGIVFTGSDAEVTDKLKVREPGRGEVRVAVQAAGVCHSDLSVIDGTIPWKPPSVLGHEGAGIVESVGPGVESVKPGDHVVITTLANCGRCRACTTGHPTWCIRSLGNVSTPFELDGEPASNFAANVGVRRADDRVRDTDSEDPRRGPLRLCMPDRMRGAHWCRLGAQPRSRLRVTLLRCSAWEVSA